VTTSRDPRRNPHLRATLPPGVWQRQSCKHHYSDPCAHGVCAAVAAPSHGSRTQATCTGTPGNAAAPIVRISQSINVLSTRMQPWLLAPQRVEQTRAAAAMNTDRAVAAVKLLQCVPTGGQRQDPRAKKRVRRGGPGADDRATSSPDSRASLAKSHEHGGHGDARDMPVHWNDLIGGLGSTLLLACRLSSHELEIAA